MKQRQKYSKWALLVEGIILVGMGLYFIILRPPMLPEDFNYIHTNATTINDDLPGLLIWLKKVFIVLGGYIVASGMLLSYLALNEPIKQTNAWPVLILVASLSSIGLMTAVNFIIDSNFKWILLFFNVPWLTSFSLTLSSNKS
ncbi:MAG TPA: hypothetical protein VFG46_19265 [Chryseolinea sp.]|nr:hypothetical protein [Chryseolinea sp.]